MSHHTHPSLSFRPQAAFVTTSGDHGHGSSSGGGSGSSGSSRGGGAGGQPPFLDTFRSHQASLENDYLWFFEGRVRLEEQYADQLSLLTQRTRALDSGTDPLGKDKRRDALPTTRRAWRQILENSEQEVESRRAFAHALKEECIAPLTSLKNTQQRIATRIAEDVKASRARYAEQAAMLQKLQKTYFQKTQAYTELVRDPSHLPTGGAPAQPHTPLNAFASSSTSIYAQHGASVSVDQTREKITDLAANSKKFFSQLRSGGAGGADEREREPQSAGGASQGGGGRKSMDEGRERAEAAQRAEKKREQNEAGALKAAKAKREAEDADAKYRLGVFHLESLRINMEKVLQGGSNSAAEFVQELVLNLQAALSKLTIAHQATEMFSFQVAQRSEEAVARISLPTDLNGGLATLGGFNQNVPPPTLYNNFWVGPCRDLIFGVSLMDYAFARGIPSTDLHRIPLIVAKCIEGVETRGLNAEGLYRISPRQSAVQALIHRIEIDEEAFEFSPAEEIYTVASIIKLYLRQLPEPVFRWPLNERAAFTQDREAHIANDFVYLKQKVKRLPAIHVATLRAVITHLRRVAFADNRMDLRNLSIIFGSILFGEEEVKNDLRLLSLGKDSALEDLILYADQIFAVSPASGQEARPPPLPSARSQLLLSRSNTVASTRTGTLMPSPASASGRSRAASASSNTTDFNPASLLPLSQGVAGEQHAAPAPVPGSRSVHGLGHRRQLSWKSQQHESPTEAASAAGPSEASGAAPPPLPPRRPAGQIAPSPTQVQQPLASAPTTSRSSPGGGSHPPAHAHPSPPPTTRTVSGGLDVLSHDADALLTQLQGSVPPRSSSLPSSPASISRTHFSPEQPPPQQLAPVATTTTSPLATSTSALSPSQLQQSSFPTNSDHEPHAL